MWRCQKCGEGIEDPFDACWACGTSRDGAEDPRFTPVVDQPELSEGLSRSRTVRGLKAGALVSVLAAFLHPFLLLFITCLADSTRVGWNAIHWAFFFGLIWAAFAAVAGGIGGAIGARAETERLGLIAGLLICVFFHLLFLALIANGLPHWPREILLGSFSIAAFTGALAGFCGFVVGKDAGSRDGRSDAA